jgi:hypothetical protein
MMKYMRCVKKVLPGLTPDCTAVSIHCDAPWRKKETKWLSYHLLTIIIQMTAKIMHQNLFLILPVCRHNPLRYRICHPDILTYAMNIIMNKGTQEKRRKCVRCMKKILLCSELKIESFSIS